MEKKDIIPKRTDDRIPVYCAHDDIATLAELIPNPRNPNQHPKRQIEQLGMIIQAQGWRAPITVSTRSGFIVRGHGRYMAAMHKGWIAAPVDYQDYSTEAEEWADLVADNRLAELSNMDDDLLADILREFDTAVLSLDMTGYSEEELAAMMSTFPSSAEKADVEHAKQTLCERFIVPPFSVLDSRQGYWRERKNAWLALGIDSGCGRDKGLLFSSPTASDPQFYHQKNITEKKLGRKLETSAFLEQYYVPPDKDNSTSVFDPVLCELAYKWFCPQGGAILDPFAGGSVRGAVAALCGRAYTGVDIREEQITANQTQWEHMQENIEIQCPDPTWVCGDSSNIKQWVTEPCDFIFTCPPYGDLEVYSNDPSDISNMPYADFLNAYQAIISASCNLLKDNRFACVVVGDIRDKKGYFRSFIGDTIAAFETAGLHYYNEGIYVTQPGGLAVRVSKIFERGRKLGKVHQNMLVFLKGDAKIAVEECGEVDVYIPEEIDVEVLLQS